MKATPLRKSRKPMKFGTRFNRILTLSRYPGRGFFPQAGSLSPYVNCCATPSPRPTPAQSPVSRDYAAQAHGPAPVEDRVHHPSRGRPMGSNRCSGYVRGPRFARLRHHTPVAGASLPRISNCRSPRFPAGPRLRFRNREAGGRARTRPAVTGAAWIHASPRARIWQGPITMTRQEKPVNWLKVAFWMLVGVYKLIT